MPKEIERKFLPSGKPFPAENSEYITLGYFSVDTDRYIRVRKTITASNTNYFISLKKIVSDIERMEVEVRIEVKEFFEIFNNCKRYLSKRRQTLELDGVEYALDKYYGKNGSIVATFIEAELKDTDKFPDIMPDFCGEEVTGRLECSNLAFSTIEKPM